MIWMTAVSPFPAFDKTTSPRMPKKKKKIYCYIQTTITAPVFICNLYLAVIRINYL